MSKQIEAKCNSVQEEFCSVAKELYSAEEEFGLAKLLSCRVAEEFGRVPKEF